MNNSSTKIFNSHVSISKFKPTTSSKIKHYHNTPASQEKRIIKNDTSIVIKESRYTNGWRNDAIADAKQAENRFYATRSTQQMPGHGFG